MTRNSPQAERLDALRIELKARGLDGFIVPRKDEYQGEDIPPSAERLAWLTGFTGSAGMAVILSDKAAVFVEGINVTDEDVLLYSRYEEMTFLYQEHGPIYKVGFRVNF